MEGMEEPATKTSNTVVSGGVFWSCLVPIDLEIVQKLHTISANFVKYWGKPLLNIMRTREVDRDMGIGQAEAIYRCLECTGGPLLCRACLCKVHRCLPFHLIERWNGSFFEKQTLALAGFVLRLGHHGLPCVTVTANKPHSP